MSAFLRKYATLTHIYVPLIKRGVVDYAVGADWTPAAGDVKVSIDGGAAANIGTLPTAIAMGNGAVWDFTLATGEVTGKKITVMVSDSATKAVEDQCFLIETYGHASAERQADLSAANLPAAVNSIAANAITATSIASNAITAAKIATDAITSAKIANDAITDAKVASDVTIASVTGAVGSVTSGVTLANTAHGGSSATIVLSKLSITNPTGNAVEFVATGGNGHGLYVIGDGSGDGVHWLGGNTGHGLNAQGGVTSGNGINASALGTGVPIVGNITGNVTGNLSGSVGSVAGTVGTLDALITSLNSTHGSGSWSTATGFAVAGDAMALTSSERTSLAAVIWNSLTSGFLTVGSIGKRIVDYLTGDAYARLGAPVGVSMSADIAAVKGDTAAIKTITDQITFTVAGAVNVNVTSWLGFVVEVDAQNYPLIGTVNTKTGYALTSAYDPAKTAAQADTALSNLVWTDAKAAYLDAAISSASAPTVNQVRDGILNATAADFDTAGTIGEKINDGGAAGDPLSNAVPGSYTVGQAGYALALIGTGNTFAPVVGRIGATGEVVDSDTIVAYHYGPVEVNPLVVLDSNNDPVDMSVYSGNLAFIVFSVDETGVETNIVRLSGSNVVVGGDNNNEITLSGTTALTATVGRFRYALRVTTTNNKLVRLQGDFIVKACANTA